MLFYVDLSLPFKNMVQDILKYARRYKNLIRRALRSKTRIGKKMAKKTPHISSETRIVGHH